MSSFHGTVIDLLQIITQHSSHPLRHITRHTQSGADRLKRYLEKHIDTTLLPIRQENLGLEVSKIDFDFVYNLLEKNRLSEHPNTQPPTDRSGREHLGQYFCDLSARDYIVIAKCAISAINQTDQGKISVSAITQGLFLDWVIFATTLRAKNMSSLLENLYKSLEINGKKNLPLIVYAYDFDDAEYRSPSMYLMQPKRNSSQAEALILGTIQNISRWHLIGKVHHTRLQS